MKLNRTKILASLLCLLMISSLLLVSCKTDPNTSKDETSKSTDNSSVTSGPGSNVKGWNGERWVSETIDPNKYKGQNKKWRVLILGSSYGTYSSREFTYSEEDVLQSDVINDAAGRKNDYIKETYGVEIVPVLAENTESEKIMTLIRNDLDANAGAYDAVMPYMTSMASIAAEGRLVDMASTDYRGVDLTKIIDLSMPWWDQGSISELAIRDKVFFATGDITLLNKVCSMAVVFNKDIITENGFENPYELVDQGKWTLEKMYEMGKAFTKDADGDGKMTHMDNWGMSSSYGDIVGFYASTGNKIIALDGNREPVLAMNGTQQIGVATKILEKLIDRSWLIHAQELDTTDAERWNLSLAIFGEGRALFRTSAFSAVEKLKMNFSVNYGIVPMPKINEEQDKYYSYVSDNGTVSAIAILDSAPDVEFSAYMIEVNAVEGKNYLTPAYYDRVLKKQAAQDEETVRMLDLIFSNTIYDVGRIYNFADINTKLNKLVENSSTDIASTLDAAKSAIEQAISDVVIKFDEMG